MCVCVCVYIRIPMITDGLLFAFSQPLTPLNQFKNVLSCAHISMFVLFEYRLLIKVGVVVQMLFYKCSDL